MLNKYNLSILTILLLITPTIIGGTIYAILPLEYPNNFIIAITLFWSIGVSIQYAIIILTCHIIKFLHKLKNNKHLHK